jgi:uncharacterized protein YdeI (YjbR/CyaY-like superfamily)
LSFAIRKSGFPSVKYPQAVDEALCYGWVDSKPNKRDDQSYYQYFAKRNPKSNWSRVNKQKVEWLPAEGRMAEPGLKMIEIAKENCAWNALDEVEKPIVPDDLQRELDQNPKALRNWKSFPPSVRRGIPEWIFNAKRPRPVESALMKRFFSPPTINEQMSTRGLNE